VDRRKRESNKEDVRDSVASDEEAGHPRDLAHDAPEEVVRCAVYAGFVSEHICCGCIRGVAPTHLLSYHLTTFLLSRPLSDLSRQRVACKNGAAVL
jgi:hypothetical protein